jgi:hypothetical protein
MQVDSMKPKLKPPGTKGLKLKCDTMLSTSVFNFNLRRYTMVVKSHDVPRDVLTGVVYLLRRGEHNQAQMLDLFKHRALNGGEYCQNDGCKVVGQMKDFKVVRCN